MDPLHPEQIKDLCEEALDITEQDGVDEGLSFLIGTKFCQVYRKLQVLQSKLKFVYDFDPQEALQSVKQDSNAYKLNFAMTVNDNYQKQLDEIKSLRKTKDQFVSEIQNAFESHDIAEYLNSYPRLGIKEKSGLYDWDESQKNADLSKEDVLAEVDDILIVEDFKKIFGTTS